MRAQRRSIAGIVVAVIALAALAVPIAPAFAEAEQGNVAAADRQNAPSVEVGYVTGWNSAAALNNGRSAATNDYTQMWGTWGDPSGPSQDWASYTWEAPVTVDSTRLFLWQNHLTGDSGVMIPSAWSLEYRTSAGEWAPVGGTDLRFTVPTLDASNPVSSLPVVEADFDPVTTTAVRLLLDRAVVGGEKKATSVIEWEVWGVDAPTVDPEPGDSGAFIEAEDVAVRTLTGEAPVLPEDVWVIGEDGPLTYLPVTWDDTAEASYASPGTFEVDGAVEGHADQIVSATVHVADELSDIIARVDYAATITTPEVAPVLPRTVRAQYDDGTASSGVGVEWEAIDEAAFAEPDVFFDVRGTVAGYPAGAVATVFVVAPSAQTGPLVAIALDTAPQGSGWYTTAPTVTVNAEATGAPVSTVEVSLDGETWSPYTTPFAVAGQGDITIRARATDADGAARETSEKVRIDTVAPTTAVDVEVIDDASALVTLVPSDAEPGSGVTRTIWSDGPDVSPTGELNNMYATYEDPFSVQLTSEPRYVHVQTQDAAGNVEEFVTVLLPALGDEALDLSAVVTSRCVVGKVQLVVTVTNADAVSADVALTTPFGAKELTVAAGATTSATLAVRAATLDSGTAQFAATSGDLSANGSVAYTARTCT